MADEIKLNQSCLDYTKFFSGQKESKRMRSLVNAAKVRLEEAKKKLPEMRDKLKTYEAERDKINSELLLCTKKHDDSRRYMINPRYVLNNTLPKNQCKSQNHVGLFPPDSLDKVENDINAAHSAILTLEKKKNSARKALMTVEKEIKAKKADLSKLTSEEDLEACKMTAEERRTKARDEVLRGEHSTQEANFEVSLERNKLRSLEAFLINWLNCYGS